MRLTLPADGHGVRRIFVDGLMVGDVLARFDDWQAFLWPVADTRPYPIDAAITEPRLRDLRAALRHHLDTQGPWWAEPEEDL